MNQKRTSTIIVGLFLALAMLAGVAMTVVAISEQAYALSGTAFCIKINKAFGGASGQEAAKNCTPAGDRT